MSIQASQVYVGGFYEAGNGQLRKVTEVSKNDKGVTQVHYLSKSINIENRPFDVGHNKTQPPCIDTFIEACNSELTQQNISDLRKKNIILPNE